MPEKSRTTGDNEINTTPQVDSRVISDLVEEELTGNTMDVFQGQSSIFDVKCGKTVHWSVSWADLMMTMFILFVVMYIYQVAHREMMIGEGNEKVADIGPGATIDAGMGGVDKLRETRAGSIVRLYDLSKQAFKNEYLKEAVSVDLVSDEAVKVILTGDLLFDLGSADLKYRAKKTLRDVAEFIRDTPYVINVVGHTDDVPNHSEKFPSNWELSSYRACSVARFLIEEMQIPEERFYISAYSSLQPRKENNSYRNRADNRRVEIILTRERPYGVPRSPRDQIRDAYSD
ncbi:MAG: flagellar motor protein MotB [Proteobacteria bacterium]|nr:flagellar motor protein MotB [Pseudomonadota bacterium]